jgi:hypothetical protein
MEDALKIISKLALAAFAMAFGTAGFAADKSSSASVFGNISSTKISGTSAFTNATVYGSYGRMLRESIEVELQLGQTISEAGGGSKFTSTSIGATGKYYFAPVGEGGAVSPYVKAGLRVNLDKASGSNGTGFGVQGGGGVEYALTESVSTFVEATYSRLKYSGDFDYTAGLFEINIGLKLRF